MPFKLQPKSKILVYYSTSDTGYKQGILCLYSQYLSNQQSIALSKNIHVV